MTRITAKDEYGDDCVAIIDFENREEVIEFAEKLDGRICTIYQHTLRMNGFHIDRDITEDFKWFDEDEPLEDFGDTYFCIGVVLD